MKIASYNINGINGRLENLLRWLKEAAPDVVCLQELKCEDKNFPVSKINQAGYHAVWRGEKSWNGVAILSKNEIKELRRDLPGGDDEFTHSRYLEAFTSGVVIGCIYLPNGNPYPGPKFEYKKRWFSRLQEHAKALLATGLPVILAGDYNVMPTELDTYKPEKYRENALFQKEIRDDFAMLVDQGWTDAIRMLYPGKRIYTFWDYLRKAYDRDAGLRLDHFLLTADLAEKLTDAKVDKAVRGWKGSSDHAPVWIELSEKPARNKTSRSKRIGGKKIPVLTREIQNLLKQADETEMPIGIKPMKATLVDEPFDQPGWLYEVKWDGYRAIAYVEKSGAKLFSRNNLEFGQFTTITAALEALKLDAVFDGEIVALKEDGSADFGALQNWKNTQRAELIYYVFDILWFKGYSLLSITLNDRRKILEAVMPREHPEIRVSKAYHTSGLDFFEAAKKMKLEGIIAKRADSFYSSDSRSREWLKIKAKRRQEVVIGGYTRNEGTEKYFSALTLGVYGPKGNLHYIGKVGTGFNQQSQKELMAVFENLTTTICPFETEPDVDEPSQFRPRRMGAKPTWLKPDLVCEIEFAELTSDGKLRQASFKGLREDKSPNEVVFEYEKDTASITQEVSLQHQLAEQPHKPSAGSTRNRKGKKLKDKGLLLTGSSDTQDKIVDGHPLKFTHLSKLYWPEEQVSKRDMFNYYDQVAPLMLPYLLDRPMSLNRFPGGIHSASFYQKNVKETAPSWARTMPHTNEKGEEKSYLLGKDRATLLWMASLGCIEMNPWFSRASSPDYPDYCVIDLDPDKNTFEQVIQAAQVTRSILDSMGVPSFPKTSGSTGIHIYIPLGAKYTYEQSQLFANLIVRQVNRELPKFTTLEPTISRRGGKMYLDFLQNRPGATIAGVYSLRPKPGATVSMPLLWDEVKPGLKMRDFTIFNAVDRLSETGDLFSGVLGKGIDMAEVLSTAQHLFS
ncbi:bifunctional non-homologous end joining protein LigD [Pedobacter suwonensis]|uniref:DNA ligase (ATP) n=1 Tax=Pedobacter suwonensis TaxID=332999 RepID=A0A1I0SQ34_9SPHI|nr:DNA ligase D [Pedobacter suwonensis]SFA41527.1 bifunctional non-homologous end joining protein LigD [Pedobacter suwonensis]